MYYFSYNASCVTSNANRFSVCSQTCSKSASQRGMTIDKLVAAVPNKRAWKYITVALSVVEVNRKIIFNRKNCRAMNLLFCRKWKFYCNILNKVEVSSRANAIIIPAALQIRPKVVSKKILIQPNWTELAFLTMTNIHRRTRRGGGGAGETMEIRANARKNQENSGKFIRK